MVDILAVSPRPRSSIWISTLFAICGAYFLAPCHADAADKRNRTLFGNRAVQRDLKLTAEQQAEITRLLDEMEAEIARQVKEAAEKKQNETEEDIATAVLTRQGPRLQQVLNKQQAVRLWQIGAQASGPDVFHNDRVARVLEYTPDQVKKLADLSEKMAKEVTALALDTKLDPKTLEQKADAAKRECFRASLAVLTEQQQKDLKGLVGRPFNLAMLKYGNGELPRPLTFVFGLTGQNWFVLMSSAETRKELELSKLQTTEFQRILTKADADMTAVRLAVLKGADKDFPDMTAGEQLAVAKKILDSATGIHQDAGRQISKLLTPEQTDKLDKRLVRMIGARSIEADSIAARLKLTDAQKAEFAKLSAKFDERTASLRVVHQQSDFDYQSFDKILKEFEESARAMLTPEQRATLANLAK